MLATMNSTRRISFISAMFFVVLLFAGCGQVAPIPSAMAGITPSLTPPVPSASVTIQSQPTIVNSISGDDTGYEGYYIGIVAIAEYYTLLDNGFLEEAYKLLSKPAQEIESLAEFTQINERLFQKIENITIQPLRSWQIENGISPTVLDQAVRINFFVQIQIRASDKTNDVRTLFPMLILEDNVWKIDSFVETFVTPTPVSFAVPTLDPGSVPDRSYYDSIVAIAQFHTFFNYGLFESAYQLLSPFRRHAQSLEEFISDIEAFEIVERRIVSIRPFYESALQLQSLPTPDPINRRKFYAQIYAEGKSGWAGSVPNGVHTYFITTVREDGNWKIYSINTSP
ncbi:MAG: hypothetical protein IT314_01990 [Anaerolineales bacterium]|nr:hypothetical protein [Anaerolineales bacterium]